MTLQEIKYRAIGTIHSPYQKTRGMPIQASAAHGVVGSVEVWPEYSAGLESLEGFSHIILLYHFHLSKPYSLRVQPYLDDQSHGVFATRAPVRPNLLALTLCEIISVKGNVIEVDTIDAFADTPVLDIKPHIPDSDTTSGVTLPDWLRQ